MKIKRGFIFLVLLLIFPLASATVIVNQQPQGVYNLGDVVTVPVTFKPLQDTSGVFQIDLLCSGAQINFYKNGISVKAGEEKVIESSLVLLKDVINESIGTCKVKAYIGSDFVLTNEFTISNSIDVQGNLAKTSVLPGENILIKGNAIKENGKAANGFVDLSIIDGNSTILSQAGTTNKGIFSINITLPGDIKSGDYLLRVTAYEEDLSGTRTNTGFRDQSIFVEQVPTSLEIVFDQTEIEPGTEVRVKAILHDQTGVSIPSSTFLTIKNDNDKILEQIEIATEEFLEFPIPYNAAPSDWKVVAASNKLTSETKFQILEKESADINIENKTVLITNTGNVPYNNTVLIKIGNQSLNIDVYLEVDESQRWLLTAPDGEYDVEVIAGESQVSAGGVLLTGDAIDIRKASAGIGSIVRFPLVWIFIIAILGFVTFIVFKRGYQKSFIGYISSGIQKRKESKEISTQSPKSNKAELTLSIKGDKQAVSMISLKIRNMPAVKTAKEGGAKEIISRIIATAEDHKAATYEAHDSLFFIFAPVKTKTFKNEERALKIAQNIKEMLIEHNKLFKQKVEFGIALTYGEMIAKQDPDSFKFMSLGSLMTRSKKIASVAHNDIFLGEEMRDKLATIVKSEKHRREGVDVYSIKDIKDHDKHQQFLKGFMKRQEKDK